MLSPALREDLRSEIGNEFHQLACKFYVKTDELGKFWQAYQKAVSKGYTGNHLAGYVGLAIRNFRIDKFKRKMADLKFKSLDRVELSTWGQPGNVEILPVEVMSGDVFGDGVDGFHLPTQSVHNEFWDIPEEHRGMVLRDRVERFKAIYADLVEVLDRWLSGRDLSVKEYRRLTKAFQEMG